MATWSVETLNKDVDGELGALSQELRSRFIRVVELIEEFGLENIGLPHIRSLGDKLWEIRFKGQNQVARGIYVVAKGRRVVVIHVFVKKTEKTPAAAIRIATQRAKKAGLL